MGKWEWSAVWRDFSLGWSFRELGVEGLDLGCKRAEGCGCFVGVWVAGLSGSLQMSSC